MFPKFWELDTLVRKLMDKLSDVSSNHLRKSLPKEAVDISKRIAHDLSKSINPCYIIPDLLNERDEEVRNKIERCILESTSHIYREKANKPYVIRGHKTWIDTFDFDLIPDDVFKEYDQMRQALADEVLVAIEDTMVETHLGYLMKRLDPLDYKLMKKIRDSGPVYHKQVYEDFGRDLGKKVLTRLKSRGVISPVRDLETGYSKYDMNDIGFEILKVLATKQQQSKDSTISTNIY